MIGLFVFIRRLLWVLSNDMELIHNKAKSLGAKLFVDATGSIGLEDYHEVGDVNCFSSCKGLFGLTGASFIGYKSDLANDISDTGRSYFNMKTQEERSVTGPYHALSSLFEVMDDHHLYKQRVKASKSLVMSSFAQHITRTESQPLLCTYLEAQVLANDSNVVL